MHEEFAIAIPSRSRPNAQKTLRNLSKHLWPRVMIVVPMEQYASYRVAVPQEVRVIPFDGLGIAAKRQFILDFYHTGKVLMMDDDLLFYAREESGKFHISTPIETEYMVRDIDRFLDTYCMVGIVDKFWSNRRPRGHVECVRFNQVLGFNRNLLPDPKPTFNIEHDEEHSFHLQLLTRGIKTAVLTEYTKSDKPNADGGCSDWRTPELSDEVCKKLSQLFPEIVTVLPARSSALERGGTLRVSYSWRRARQIGGLLP